MSVSEIMAEVQKHPTRFCVVTGGEPMIARGIGELLHALHADGKHITIETAGTVLPDGVPCDLASLSPKLSNSTPTHEQGGQTWVERHEATRWRPDVVRAWCKEYDCQLKFVVAGENDLSEITRLLVESGIQMPPEKVLLMPEARTVEEQALLAPQVVEWCKARGWRYCTRLHIDLFGNKRGT